MTGKVDHLWDAATPLSEAWLKYAHSWSVEGEKDRENYRAFENPGLAMRRGWPLPQGYERYFIEGDYEFLERKRQQWERNFKDDLREQLGRGDCLAYGKPWLPERLERIEPVPGLLFSHDEEKVSKIDFQSGFVEAYGRAFVDLRVLSKTEFERLTVKPGNKRRGPISRKPEIEAAIRELIAENPDWLNGTFNVRHAQIIRKAKKLFDYIDGNPPKGFSRTVVDEVIEEKF